MRNPLTVLAMILVIVGGLNWGLVGFLDFNLVDAIFGSGSLLSRTVYALVGASAVVVAGGAFAQTGQKHAAV